MVVAHIDGHLRGIDASLIDFRFIATLIPGSAGAITKLPEGCVRSAVLHIDWRPTIGILVPSFNFKFGIGVWIFAMVASPLLQYR